MRWVVTRTSDTTWEVEPDTDDAHYVKFDIFKDRWTCDCGYNSITEKCCKHILYAKQNLVFNISVFEDEYVED